MAQQALGRHHNQRQRVHRQQVGLPAQQVKILRRQAGLLIEDPLPLIVMTPKSLLRQPAVASSLNELATGCWQPLIDDSAAREQPERVRRLIWCSGKVYFDLTASPLRAQHPEAAVARVEQLYPFRPDDYQVVLNNYPRLDDVVWVQEEPENMGAWEFLRPNLESVLAGRWPLRYVGRVRNASPAEGSSARHTLHQAALIEQAFAALPAHGG